MNTGSNYTYHVVDAYNGSDDIFDGGNKIFNSPSSWGWKTGSALSKNDLNNINVHFSRSKSVGDYWAILTADRQTTNGTSYLDFELSQAGITKTFTAGKTDEGSFSSAGPACGRTMGDMLITVEYSSGGSIDSIYFYHWNIVTGNNSCSSNGNAYGWKQFWPTWDHDANSNTPKVAAGFGVSNSGTTGVPYGAYGNYTYTSSTNQFVEIAVNLSEVINTILSLNSSSPCMDINFESLLIKTKASDAFTADIKDLVDPFAINLNFGRAKISGTEYCTGTNDGDKLMYGL